MTDRVRELPESKDQKHSNNKGQAMPNDNDNPIPDIHVSDAIRAAEKTAEAALGILRGLTESAFEAADGHDQRMQVLTVYGDNVAAMVRALAIAARPTRFR